MNAQMPPRPIDVEVFANEPAFPYSTATESYHHAFAHHRGLTRGDQVFIRVLAGYIAAGSNGMPSPEELVARADETTELALRAMAARHARTAE